jgi:hypothetical protein
LRALEQRSHRDARCNTAGAAGVPWTLCALLCAFVEVSAAYAQPAATLNGYRATPLPGDGFVVSGAAPSAHLELSLQLHADYANDPLVFEGVAGEGGTERAALVSDQLTLHPMVTLGLFDSALVFVGMPVHVMMKGPRLWPAARRSPAAFLRERPQLRAPRARAQRLPRRRYESRARPSARERRERSC